MSPNRRIFLNVVATYGRSIYTLGMGLLCGRWVFRSLGEVDYGLIGLVGGLTAFVSFLNGLMASSVGRFYAYSVGSAMRTDRPVEADDDVVRWFNIAVSIHTVLPLLLVCIGYPVGVWAVRNFLAIPVDRVECCVWVWRYSCLSCLVSMMSVPFCAMYTAKQEIAEQTVYGVAAATVNYAFTFYMVTHPGEWLVRYSAWLCFIEIAPVVVLSVRAMQAYPECKFRIEYMWSGSRFRELLEYAAGRCVCALTLMLGTQGRSVLVNKYIGPAANAALSIGSTVSSQTVRLTGSLVGAFNPAIANAIGAGDYGLARKLGKRICKFAPSAIAVFAVPLMLEADEAIALWLGNPPFGASFLCTCLLVDYVVSHLTDGHWMLILASGNHWLFNSLESIAYASSVIATWVMMACGVGLAAVGVCIVAQSLFTTVVKVYYARRLGFLYVREWAAEAVVPVLLVCFSGLAAGSVSRFCMDASWVRMVVTTIVAVSIMIPICLFRVLDSGERGLLAARLRSALDMVANRRT